jgi:hypothetical protein
MKEEATEAKGTSSDQTLKDQGIWSKVESDAVIDQMAVEAEEEVVAMTDELDDGLETKV